MELIIANKWFSFKGSSIVKDTSGKDFLCVEGKFFSIHNRKFIKSLDGQLLYQTASRVFNWVHHVIKVLDAQGNEICEVKDKILTLHDHYNIESKYGPIVIRGNILGFDYHISLSGKEIGHIARKISLRDSFVLNIDDDVDIPFFVALVIAIDNITDEKQAESTAVYHH